MYDLFSHSIILGNIISSLPIPTKFPVIDINKRTGIRVKNLVCVIILSGMGLTMRY